MPCDIGYKSVERGEVAEPAPEVLEGRAEPPEIDRELCDRLGVDDPVFLEWIRDLDPQPLLEAALDRTRASGTVPAEVDLRIDGGALRSRTPRARALALAGVVARWQIEVLRIVCELLDYEVELEERDGALVIEGERRTDADVREYVAISTAADGRSLEVRFEHFASERVRERELAKFHALAQKLGVRLRIVHRTRTGQPIAPGTVHGGKHRGKA